MWGDGIAATVMLGLPGFVVAVSEYAGEFEQAVQTTADQDWCPGCGVRARLHDRRPSWVRDLPAAGRPVTGCGSTPWTRSAAASSGTPSGIADTPATRCSVSAGCCARARTPHRKVLGTDARRARRRRPGRAGRPNLDRHPRTPTALPRAQSGPSRAAAAALVHRRRRARNPRNWSGSPAPSTPGGTSCSPTRFTVSLPTSSSCRVADALALAW